MTHQLGLSPGARRRHGAGALLAAVAAVLALGAFASAASAAPSVTLTHDFDLVTNPAVEVEGTGFTSPTPVLNPAQGKIGLYAAQTALVDGTIVIGAAQQWIRPAAFEGSGPTLLNGDGTFSSELDVDQVIGTAPDEVDCAEVQCYISTWQAHGNPAVGQFFTQSPIYFAPTVNPEPAQGIAATGETISVTGGGFDPDMNPAPNPPNAPRGFYFAQAAIVDVSGAPTVKTGPAQWIRPADYPNAPGSGVTELRSDGTFESELTLSSTFTSGGEEVNCGLVQCEIISWPAQTQPSVANLITRGNISFAYSPSATVTPTTDLPETQQVTVSGSGYAPGDPGVYVSQVAQVGDSIITPPPTSGDTTQWVRPTGLTPNEKLNPDGTFETSITVSRTFKDADGATVDCSVVECSVITWRAHTNPTSATLYSSAPLAFAPPAKKPDEIPPVTTPPTTPPSAPPSAKVTQQKQFQLGTKARKLSFVTFSCGSAVCSFQKPQRVAVKLGKRKLWLTVTGPKRTGAGKVAKFGVRVKAGIAKQLAGRKARVKFNVQASSDSGQQTITIDKLLVGAPK